MTFEQVMCLCGGRVEEVEGMLCAEALNVVMVMAGTHTCMPVRNGACERVQLWGPSLDKQKPRLQFSLAP